MEQKPTDDSINDTIIRMEDLFQKQIDENAPLADRMRPRTLDEFIGQKHIVGEGKLLRRAILTDRLQSSIFFGPPGTGKTTLAAIVANATGGAFVKLNAVTAGVKELRAIVDEAEQRLRLYRQPTYLLLDECHRWNKTQSDSLLPALEKGVIRFIGSTTENPMIAMTSAIVSRCRVFQFYPLTNEDVEQAILHALKDEERGFGKLPVVLEEEVGDVHCTVRLERRGASFAYFALPRLPEKLGEADARALADALSLEEKDIGFDGHRPVVWSAGTPFCFVPVSGLDAIARARPDAQKLTAASAGGRGAYLYTRETRDPASAVHARMFSAMMPGLEDPATGGAAAAFAGVAHAFEAPEDGEHALVIEQGFEMGRPSLITLGMSVHDGALVAATIGGHAVRISEGTLLL